MPADPDNPGLARHPEWFAAWWPAGHPPAAWRPVVHGLVLGGWGATCLAFAHRWSTFWPTAPASEGLGLAAVLGAVGLLILRTVRPLYAGHPPAYRLTPEGLEIEVLRTPLIAGRWGWTRFRRVVDYDAVRTLQWVAYVPPTQVVCSPGVLAEPYWLMRSPEGEETGEQEPSRGTWTPPVALALETAEGWVLVAPAEPHRLTRYLEAYCPALGGTMPGRAQRRPWPHQWSHQGRRPR